MVEFLTPGVYFQRVDSGFPQITALRTDVAAFVGIASRGPVNTPVPVESWRQFEAHFGSFTGVGYLAYAVRAFFENGGRRCWAVRVSARYLPAREAGLDLLGSLGTTVWRVEGSSPGIWANSLSAKLTETNLAQTISVPRGSSPEATRVESIAGFERAMLIRLEQEGASAQLKVLSGVDAIRNRLLWLPLKPEDRLPYDAPLSGFDPHRPLAIESVEHALLVYENRVPIGIYRRLSAVPEHERYGPTALAPLEYLDPLPSSQSQTPIPRPVQVLEITSPTGTPQPLQSVSPAMPLRGGTDGISQLSAQDYIGEEPSPQDSEALRHDKARGIRALDAVNEVSMIAVPDLHIRPKLPPVRAPLPPCEPDPCLLEPEILPMPAAEQARSEVPPVFEERSVFEVQSFLVDHCESRTDRIALLDPPFSASRDDALGTSAILAWRTRFDSTYAALYYPWVAVVDPIEKFSGELRELPPSGHVAGQIASTDLQRGVHVAPANSIMRWLQTLTVSVNPAVQGLLNPKGINAIRSFPGRGIRIFGARTVSSDPDWRYLNVRRLLIMIRKAIDVSTQWAVFEPNDVHTRNKINLALGSFLLSLWQVGALAGASPEAAFFVKCDEENNPAEERDRGRFWAEVGVAPSKPFEFIVVRVGRRTNSLEITEVGVEAPLWQ